VGEGRLANPAEGDAGDGDAKLGRGDVGVEVIEAAQDRGGPPVSFRGQMLDAGAPDGNEGKLGGDEEPVGENEGDDREQRKQGTNRNILTVAGATGPGTRGDSVPMRPGSPDQFSVICGSGPRRGHASLVPALLA
jgi:hypothetical protein